MKISRKVDFPALVQELGNNKIDALELLREAISNAKDHGAKRLWVRAHRGAQGRVSIALIDDGDGLDESRWGAFWGAARSVKNRPSIGYKGFGTKLFFRCSRLSVASRTVVSNPWSIAIADRPHERDDSIDSVDLPVDHSLHALLAQVDLLGGKGTAILIEDLLFSDRDNLLSRERIESYCDWFTVLGDVRAGLFDSRIEFHRAVAKGGAAVDGLRNTEVPIEPIELLLQINGELNFTPLGLRRPDDSRFFGPWADDVKEFRSSPAIIMFGHRFADQYAGGVARGGQAKDDRTALRLSGPSDWVDEHGIGIIAHVEGHRRQRETYTEARWQGKRGGIYAFEERFGLWLCRDYVPVAQRNDLLRRAIEEVEPRGIDRDFRNLRNWKVFVNDQTLLPIANRGEVSNYAEREGRLYEALLGVLRRAYKQSDFASWVAKLRSARRERERDAERSQMDRRREDIIAWVNKQSPGSIDVTDARLNPLDPGDSLRIREPRNEQELFYLYAQLSSRFEVPVFILEYNTREGIDAMGKLRPGIKLFPSSIGGYVRVEFKYEVEQGYPIGHYFDAIDLLICWSVGKTGGIDEEDSATEGGILRRRQQPVLSPSFDTHEIKYELAGKERVIPILQLKELFFPAKVAPKRTPRVRG